jgi:hypothetical protein
MIDAARDTALIQAGIREQAEARAIRFTLHGHEEMAEEGIFVAEVLSVSRKCEIIENYLEHSRGRAVWSAASLLEAAISM